MQKILQRDTVKKGITKITGLDSNSLELQKNFEKYIEVNREA